MKPFKKIAMRYFQLAQRILTLDQLSAEMQSGSLTVGGRLQLVRGGLLRAPFCLGRTIRGTAFENPDLDPLYKCLVNYWKDTFDEAGFVSALMSAVEKESNQRVSDFVGDLQNKSISSLPSWTVVYPWEKFSHQYLKKHYLQLLSENRSEYLTEYGVHLDHPFSENYAKSHAVQLRSLITSIRREGFRVNTDLPRAFVLLNGSDWRWVMAGNGNHRAYSMAFLGYSALPITVNGVIRRENCEKWSNVVGGDYTAQEALKVFDTVFEGNTLIRGCV